MKVGIGIGSAYYNGEDWQELVQYTMAADSMGVDYVWSVSYTHLTLPTKRIV